MCATETAPSYRPCPSPSASRLAASPSARAHGSDPAASLTVVRQALEKALLQANEDFWAANPPNPDAMDLQDPFRRNKLAMQFFLRLHILVACKGGVPLTHSLARSLTHSLTHSSTHSLTQKPCIMSLLSKVIFCQVQVMRKSHLHSEQALQSVQTCDSATAFTAESQKCPGLANAQQCIHCLCR